jgi:hypothetical protein
LWCFIVLNVRHFQLTFDRPWKVNAIQNRCPASRLFSKSLTKHFKGFDSGFIELHAKLDADTLLGFAIHRRENETRIRKALV